MKAKSGSEPSEQNHTYPASKQSRATSSNTGRADAETHGPSSESGNAQLIAAQNRAPRPELPRLYYVYVIELTDEAGPRVNIQKPCAYVGQTSTSPEERFAQHKRGYKASRKVRKYGVRLRARLYTTFNPLQTREDAEATERRLADRLTRRGFTVFSG